MKYHILFFLCALQPQQTLTFFSGENFFMGVCDIGNFKSSLHCVCGAIFQLIQLIIMINWDVHCYGDRLCHGLELNVATAPTNTAS